MSRFKDKCNVTVCDELHDEISHYYTEHKYCWMCARKINEANTPKRIFSEEDMIAGGKLRRKKDAG